MGDVHFLLRHAIVGGVFLLFLWIGWWAGSPEEASAFLALHLDEATGPALLASAAAPVIGITIQGIHILALSAIGLRFKDRGRQLVASAIREAIDRCSEGQSAIEQSLRVKIKRAPDDSLFVWLYHRSAPAELIEWARRRRSYYYLGVNLALGAAGGLVFGWVATRTGGAAASVKMVVVGAGALLWATGAFIAGQIMRRDVDRMELLWAAARVHPTFKSCLEAALGTTVDETYPGDEARRARRVPGRENEA
jgi:hypothetical protein